MQKDVELGTIAGYKRTTEYKSIFSRIPAQHHASLLILLPAFCCCLLIFGIIVCIFYARKKTAKVDPHNAEQLTQQSNVISQGPEKLEEYNTDNYSEKSGMEINVRGKIPVNKGDFFNQ